MMKRSLKRMQCVGSVLMYVKKEIRLKWNAAAKVTSDLYMKNVQLSGLALKETRLVKYVGKRFRIYR
jgi:hypothetical protein